MLLHIQIKSFKLDGKEMFYIDLENLLVFFRHPNEISFTTTSADRTCLVWAPSQSALSTLAQSP
jgi:hypothetical protein